MTRKWILWTVLAVFALVAYLVVAPTYQSFSSHGGWGRRTGPRKSRCVSNLLQLNLALTQYRADRKCLPVARDPMELRSVLTEAGYVSDDSLWHCAQRPREARTEQSSDYMLNPLLSGVDLRRTNVPGDAPLVWECGGWHGKVRLVARMDGEVVDAEEEIPATPGLLPWPSGEPADG